MFYLTDYALYNNIASEEIAINHSSLSNSYYIKFVDCIKVLNSENSFIGFGNKEYQVEVIFICSSDIKRIDEIRLLNLIYTYIHSKMPCYSPVFHLEDEVIVVNVLTGLKINNVATLFK